MWQPDARFVDPAFVTDGSPRTAFLNVFNAGPAGGDWTLFLADLSGGGQLRLEHWRLEIVTAAAIPIPEPTQAARLAALSILALAGWRRWRR